MKFNKSFSKQTSPMKIINKFDDSRMTFNSNEVDLKQDTSYLYKDSCSFLSNPSIYPSVFKTPTNAVNSKNNKFSSLNHTIN